MKVLLVNGSPHKEGCTYTALCEVAVTLNNESIETEIFWIGNKPIGGCIACLKCREKGACVFDDVVNCFRKKAYEADGFVFGSPVHYAAAVISARRAGTTATFDQLNKYFTIQEMPVVSSRYWNMVHGTNAEQVRQDAEGLYTMRVLGKNMAYLLRCQEAARKAGIAMPEREEPVFTNFIK